MEPLYLKRPVLDHSRRLVVCAYGAITRALGFSRRAGLRPEPPCPVSLRPVAPATVSMSQHPARPTWSSRSTRIGPAGDDHSLSCASAIADPRAASLGTVFRPTTISWFPRSVCSVWLSLCPRGTYCAWPSRSVAIASGAGVASSHAFDPSALAVFGHSTFSRVRPAISIPHMCFYLIKHRAQPGRAAVQEPLQQVFSPALRAFLAQQNTC